MASARSARPFVVAGLALAIIGADLPARAWGDEGHQIVANVAYARLSPAAKMGVDAMLAADADSLTAKDFVSRATWADKWRDSDRNTTKVRFEATHKWHFADIEIDGGTVDIACGQHPPLPAGTPASKGPPKTCVVDKINQFQTELGNPATAKAERLLALKFLLHFVGDLHQPLHASDHHDGGGNSQKVMHGAITVADNLHSYWDRELVQRLGRDPKAVGLALTNAISPAQASQWASGDTASWANEANTQAKAVAYDFSGEQMVDDHQGGKAPYLAATYDNRALPVVREQLSKAGVRLAAMLNGALK